MVRLVKILGATALFAVAIAQNGAQGGNGKDVQAANKGQANNQAQAQADKNKQNANANANNGNDAAVKAGDAAVKANDAKQQAADAKQNAADAKASGAANANANNNKDQAAKDQAAKDQAAKDKAAQDAAKNGNNANAAQGNNSASANNNKNADASKTAGNNDAASVLQLNANAIQSGSFFDGSDGLGAEDTQVASLTDKANFINFCSGKTLTNGLQITTGSCNGIPMGDIPTKENMISLVFTNPQNGQTLEAGKDFNITLTVANLQAGAFTNADATYYAAPQTLNKAGLVIGHVHVVVQDTGVSQNPKKPLDAKQFAFFKGINDDGNSQGDLQAQVIGGLKDGFYRLCSITSASNHQSVVMPVAQRGSQEDCVRFTVKGNGGGVNDAANNGKKGQEAAQKAQDAVNLGPGALTSSAAAAANTAAAAANKGNANANNNKDQAAKDQAAKDQAAKDQAAKDKANANANKGQQNAQQGKQQGKAQRLARLTRRTFVS